MKIKCGTDIIEINRIKDGIDRIGDKFINRIFTKKEIEYCESKKNQKYQHYAARFAAKEAAFKALSWAISDKYQINWTDFEIVSDKQGKPSLKVYCIKADKNYNMDISISHCKEYAVANVTVIVE